MNGLFIAALQLCVAPRLVHATAKDNAEIKAGTKQDPVPNLTQGKTRYVLADKALIDRLQGASRALFFMLTPIGVKKLTPDTRGCHFVSLGVQNVYPV